MSIYGDEYGKIEFEILAMLYRVCFSWTHQTFNRNSLTRVLNITLKLKVFGY